MRRFLYSTHRLLGCILSLLFLMWFISGIVLMYHGFPRFSREEALAQAPALDADKLPSMDSIQSMLFAHGVDTAVGYPLEIESNVQGQQFITALSGEQKLSIDLAGDTLSNPRVDEPYLQMLASRWQGAEILRIDTVKKLDTWLPFSQMRQDLPFYRLKLSGDEGRLLYVSSLSGRILHESTRSERAWAYVGALPHWIYITALRQNVELWKKVIIYISAFGCFMVLTGLYIGIDVYYRSRKNKKLKGLQSPYRKRRYRWHHILGTLGGVFILTWIFSGMMSLMRLPEWITGPSPEMRTLDLQGSQPNLDGYIDDYRSLLAKLPESRKIRWTAFDGRPVIELESPQEKVYFDCSGKAEKPLELTERELGEPLSRAMGQEPSAVELMSKYDEYYSDRKGRLPLPVYKFSFDDEYASVIYINPKTGDYRKMDRASKMNRWAYGKLHSLNIGFLVRNPLLWELTMWILLLLGVVVSATAVWMSWDYLRRKARKAQHRKQKKQPNRE